MALQEMEVGQTLGHEFMGHFHIKVDAQPVLLC
jgi:hypothetical protein